MVLKYLFHYTEPKLIGEITDCISGAVNVQDEPGISCHIR